MNLIADQEKGKLKIAILYDDEFILHNTGPNHPENPDRLSSVINFLKNDSKLQPNLIWPTFGYASTDVIQPRTFKRIYSSC
jgi:acetoin utilization deacetylase AcuC-like enzyme